MNKKCKQCSNEFHSTNNKGSEQLYCSKECQRKAGAERYKQNLINKHLQDENAIRISQQRTISQKEERGSNEIDNRNSGISGTEEVGMDRGINRNEPVYNTITIGEYIKIVTENASLSSELKYLREKINELEVERGQLLAELENYEQEDEEEESEELGMFSGIVDAYKKEPTATISFAKDMIFEFLKPKTPTQPNAKI